MRLRFILGVVAVVLLAAGSISAALVVHAKEEDHFDSIQRDEASRSARQAEATAQLSVGELATAAAFFQAEGHFDRDEFETIGRSLLMRGALTATAYVERVRGPDRAAFERAHGFPIIEKGSLGRPRRAARRPEYFPVTYIVAEESGKAPLGYDIGSEPQRAPYLRRALLTGKPTATPVIPLVIGGEGINVYWPVYRNEAPIATAAERRAALLGFAAGAFRIKDLAAAAIAAIPSDVTVQLRAGNSVVIGPSGRLEEAASAPLTIAGRTWLLVVRDPDRPAILLPLLIAIGGVALAALLGVLVLVWSRNERIQELQRLADHDSLTGLKNRRRFEEELRTALARSRREGTRGALLMLDLDEFKTVNDTLGHPTGDHVIEEIAGILNRRLRETDVLARIGGDEFAIVLPNCDAVEAHGVADTIVAAIRDRLPKPDGAPQVTASVGVALFGAGTGASFESVVADADAAMYAAKQAGRDGVSLA